MHLFLENVPKIWAHLEEIQKKAFFSEENVPEREREYERERKTAQPQRDFKAAEYQRRLNTYATGSE